MECISSIIVDTRRRILFHSSPLICRIVQLNEKIVNISKVTLKVSRRESAAKEMIRSQTERNVEECSFSRTRRGEDTHSGKSRIEKSDEIKKLESKVSNPIAIAVRVVSMKALRILNAIREAKRWKNETWSE